MTNLYAWTYNSTTVYTLSPNPQQNDVIYKADGSAYTMWELVIGSMSYDIYVYNPTANTIQLFGEPA